MDISELTTAFAQHDPDATEVLAGLRTKRRRRTHTRLLTGTALGGCVIIAVAVVLSPSSTSPPNSGTAPAQAQGCAAMSLDETLAAARSGGASVVIAHGALPGRQTQDSGGSVYDAMVLSSVRTLAGPAIASGSTVWVSGGRGPSGPVPGTDAGALWAPDGQLFGIVWPQQATGLSVGLTLRIAPVVNDQVILSTAGCWDATGLPSTLFHGQLAELPGSNSYARAAASGFHAVPLSTVEHLAAR